MPPKRKKQTQTVLSFTKTLSSASASAPSKLSKISPSIGNSSSSNINSLIDELSSESDDDNEGRNNNSVFKRRKLVPPIPSPGIKNDVNSSGSSHVSSIQNTSALEETNCDLSKLTSTNTSENAKVKIMAPIAKQVRFVKSVSGPPSPHSSPLSSPIVDYQSIPWIEKHSPKSTKDVAIHAKKISEIRQALIDMDPTVSPTRQLFRPRILIISGPTSSSKTAAFTTLAAELGYKNILEWHNHDRIEDGAGLPESFEDFLAGAMFSGKLSFSSRQKETEDDFKKIILVEDLPNISHYDTKQRFNVALLQWINYPMASSLPPLVLIISEYEVADETRIYYGRSSTVGGGGSGGGIGSIITERVLSRKILEDSRVIRVKVPAINITLMTKTLRAVVKEESEIFSKIPKSEIDSSIRNLSTNGDLRAAINGFEFWARWRSSALNKQLPISRDNYLDIFHAVGRIIHGSHKDSKGRPVIDDASTVDSVLQDWEYNNRDGTLSLAIFENYPGANSSRMLPRTLSDCSEILSESDTLMPVDMPTIMSEICFRGVRYTIRTAKMSSAAKPVFRPLVYPRERKANFRQLEIAQEYDAYGADYAKAQGTLVNKSDCVLLDGYYEYLIGKEQRPQQQQQSFSLDRFGKVKTLFHRLGGSIIFGGNIKAELNEENEEDISGKLKNQLIDNKQESKMSLTFSDDDIEDSEED